jgi:DNA (cytosine-5)-methyltransferase 1
VKLLDLFCCCGGISKGFADNGFECTGVDITDNHQYPYEFIQSDQSDVFKLPLYFFQDFDIIHASPPCQFYSWAARKHKKEYPDLIGKTRDLLNKVGKPYIIENVVGAPLRKDLVLCGEMFRLRVIRHRIFEIHGVSIFQPAHSKHKEPVGNKSWYMTVAGHGGNSYSFKLKDWQNAMEIHWVDKKEHLTQMIPPAYSNYISRHAH